MAILFSNFYRAGDRVLLGGTTGDVIDIDLTQSILEKIANLELSDFTEYANTEWEVMVDKYRIENASVEPMVFILANDNWIEFSLRYVVDYQRRSIKDKLFKDIIEEINKSNGKVQLASATFELVSLPSMKISIDK
jgi:small-conductance mechanosensitive channel